MPTEMPKEIQAEAIALSLKTTSPVIAYRDHATNKTGVIAEDKRTHATYGCLVEIYAVYKEGKLLA